jgi:hypothetical protein
MPRLRAEIEGRTFESWPVIARPSRAAGTARDFVRASVLGLSPILAWLDYLRSHSSLVVTACIHPK